MEQVAKRNALILGEHASSRKLAYKLERAGFSLAHGGHDPHAATKRDRPSLIICFLSQGQAKDLLKQAQRMAPQPSFVFVGPITAYDVPRALDDGADAVFDISADADTIAEVAIASTESKSHPRTRRYQRYHLAAKIRFQVSGIPDQVELAAVNIGIGGMFLALPNQPLPALGERLPFEISGWDQHYNTISGTAVVRWARPDAQGGGPRGIGVEFLELATDARRAVLTLVNDLRTRRLVMHAQR